MVSTEILGTEIIKKVRLRKDNVGSEKTGAAKAISQAKFTGHAAKIQAWI